MHHFRKTGLICTGAIIVTVFHVTIGVADSHNWNDGGLQTKVSKGPISRKEIEKQFIDGIRDFSPTSISEREIQNLIINNIQAGYEQFDVRKIEQILAPDFERRIKLVESNFSIESRDQFLEARKYWGKHGRQTREVHYSNIQMATDPGRDKVAVFMLSNYQTKYFSPKYIESHLYTKAADRWLLKRQVLVPIYFDNPSLYDVQIFVADRQWPKYGRRSLQKNFPIAVIESGPDYLIDLHQQKSRRRGYPGDEIERTVLFVFREPPPVGSKIEVEHQYWRPWAQNLQPSKFIYTVEKSDPFFLIENRTSAGGSGGTITFTVRLNGEKIARKTIEIY